MWKKMVQKLCHICQFKLHRHWEILFTDRKRKIYMYTYIALILSSCRPQWSLHFTKLLFSKPTVCFEQWILKWLHATHIESFPSQERSIQRIPLPGCSKSHQNFSSKLYKEMEKHVDFVETHGRPCFNNIRDRKGE